MRKAISWRPDANTENGKNIPASTTTNKIWKTLLVVSAVVFLNLVNITQNFLASVDQRQHPNIDSSWSVAVRNKTSNERLNPIVNVEDNGHKDDKTSKTINTKVKIAERHPEQENDENGVGSSSGEKNHLVKPQAIKSKGSDANHAVLAVPQTGIATTGGAAKPEAADAIEYTQRWKASEYQKRRRKEHSLNKGKNEDSNRTLSPEEKLKYTYEETAIKPNVSNAVYYRDIPPEYLVEDPSVFLWDRADAMIPEWIKDYFRWHRWKRSTWKNRKSPLANNNNTSNNNTTGDDWWKSERWLISQCLITQDRKKCGGTADRLKPVPILLRYAYEHKRIYLIRWTRPAPLEEFLLPPRGGFDWRVPPDLAEVMEDSGNGKRLLTRKTILNYCDGGMSLIRTRYQTSNPGIIYDEMVSNETVSEIGEIRDRGQLRFDEVFSRMWKIMFTPSPPIQNILRSRLASLSLVPDEYVASHLRALYAIDDRPANEIQRYTENALACATEIYPGVPIFFASDSTDALKHAQGFNGKEVQTIGGTGGSITLRVTTPEIEAAPPNPVAGDKNITAISQPWHLDSFLGPIENFYDTFVDLYTMALAGCVTYNKGGYGHWGMLIGGHPYCAKRQHIIGTQARKPKVDFCSFKAATETHVENNTSDGVDHRKHPSVFGKDDAETGPLFLLPMD